MLTVVPYNGKIKTKQTSLELMSPSVLDNYRRGLYYYLHTCALLSKQQDKKIFLKGVGVSLYPWECIILFLYFSRSSRVYEWVLEYFIGLHLKEVDKLYSDETLWAVANKVSDGVLPMMQLLQKSINECADEKLIDEHAVIKFKSLPTCSHGYLTLWKNFIVGDYEKHGEFQYPRLSTDFMKITDNLKIESNQDENALQFIENGSQATSSAIVPAKKLHHLTDLNYQKAFPTYTNFCKVECTRNGQIIEGMIPAVVLQLFNCISTSSEEYNTVFSKFREWHKHEPDVMYMKDCIQKMMLMILHAVRVHEAILDKYLDKCSAYQERVNGIKPSILVARFRKLSNSSQFFMFVFKGFENEEAHDVKETLMRLYAMISAKVEEHNLKWSDDE